MKEPATSGFNGFFIMHKNTKHGMRKTPEYDAWRGMKKRCTLKSRKDYLDVSFSKKT